MELQKYVKEQCLPGLGHLLKTLDKTHRTPEFVNNLEKILSNKFYYNNGKNIEDASPVTTGKFSDFLKTMIENAADSDFLKEGHTNQFNRPQWFAHIIAMYIHQVYFNIQDNRPYKFNIDYEPSTVYHHSPHHDSPRSPQSPPRSPQSPRRSPQPVNELHTQIIHILSTRVDNLKVNKRPLILQVVHPDQVNRVTCNDDATLDTCKNLVTHISQAINGNVEKYTNLTIDDLKSQLKTDINNAVQSFKEGGAKKKRTRSNRVHRV